MEFEAYRPRKISFLQLSEVDDWKVKIYAITNKKEFTSYTILQKAITKLPLWLKKAEKSKIPLHRMAFLIVHEAREGVWILINWWTGGEMIETKVYFARYNAPNLIRKSPHSPHSLLCVWELEVFLHERKTWIKEVLQNPGQPRFNNYLHDVIQH
ncbi:hypothetical protein [Flagellimonas flava]|uniref:Uncharacterized protein n=1 Tax=Flagellimonas flava TaxID=570519 RepID=A0A1M5LSA3_9FLAO|nr:hypothetical protein [Allomuricauda flava]SHG67891.1 hypothetical protein SAMN04488116_2062 [Allomuricauda flava]